MTDENILNALAGCQPPAWELLPDFGLYMDQLLTFVERSLPGLGSFPGLTAAMINNYVKAGLLDKPAGKKYSRDSIAQLMMICLLKQSLPQDNIRQLLHEGGGQSTEEIYTAFRSAQQESMIRIRQRLEDLSGDGSASGVFSLALESASLSLVTRFHFLGDKAEA